MKIAWDYQPWKLGDNRTELQLPYMWSWRVNVVDSLILQLHTPTHTALTGPHIHCRWCKAQCGYIFLLQNIEGNPLTESSSDKWDNFWAKQFYLPHPYEEQVAPLLKGHAPEHREVDACIIIRINHTRTRTDIQESVQTCRFGKSMFFISFLSNMEDLTWKMWQDYRNYTFFSPQTLSWAWRKSEKSFKGFRTLYVTTTDVTWSWLSNSRTYNNTNDKHCVEPLCLHLVHM